MKPFNLEDVRVGERKQVGVVKVNGAGKAHNEYLDKISPVVLEDPVDKPKHYQIFPEYGLEVMDIILRVIQLSGLNGRKAYLLGNALKYLMRLGRKGGVKEDAGKARHYCKRIEDE